MGNMAGVKSLVALAFTGSIGLLFFFLSPIPNLLARRHSDDSASNPCRELALFITTGIVVSAFALPIVLARAPVAADTPPNPPNSTVTNITTTTVISGGACGLVLTANSIMFLTILGFFIAFDTDDVQYSVW